VSKAFLPLTSWKFPNAPDNFINWKFPGAPTNFLLWNWPTLPKWTWPALPSLGINFDANAIGVNIGAGFWNKLAQLGVSNLGSDMAGGLWNKLLQLGISNLGSDMAVGLWNKLITFDFGKLLGGGGGSSLPKLFGSTGGMVTNDGFKYFASGGLARGTDTVPAMLTPGEFVVNRQATRENFRELRDINSGRGQQASAGIVIQKIEINGVNKTADQIASEIIPKIDQHLRRKSQDGGMVIAKSGVRG
jgi:hypothetical protein